jgi:hypothetical protein
MKRKRAIATILFWLGLGLPAAAAGDVGVGPGGGEPGTALNFEVVGENSLFDRGMNAAPAFFEDPATGRRYVYVGNRTDGQPRHPRPGILVVDVTDPAAPTVVNEIGPPFAGNIGETTRELRVWWEKRLLVVLSFRCSPRIHDCASDEELRERGEFPVRPTLRFFDLTEPANPVHRMTYVPTQRDGTVRVPHEFFLWVDPKDDDRALLWASTPTSSCDTNRANLVIYDVSGVPAGVPPTVLSQGNWNHLYEGGCNAAQYDFNLALHSMGVNATGTRTHLAYLRGNYLTLDTRALAFLPNAGVGTDTDHDGVPDRVDAIDLSDDLLTPPASRPRWGASPFVCTKAQAATGLGCGDAHSAVEVPGPRKPLVLTTDEIYGTFTDHYHGCPWGWVRLIDISHPETPVIVGEYRVKENVCPPKTPDADALTSFAAHNPTVLEPSLALVTWHSAGLQAIDLADPARPEQAGWFSPAPRPVVATEDPALSRGLNKVVMWSYPIVEDGLVYVVDVRNGLYVLKYNGPHQGTVLGTRFMEGNSNLGELGNLRNFDQGR